MTFIDQVLPPQLTAIRCLFLVAMHHGLRLLPDELPVLTGDDMLASVLRAMKGVGLKGRALHRCTWQTVGALGQAYPAMAVRQDGSWFILVHVIPGPDGTPHAAILDPAREAQGVQLLSRERFEAGWNGTLLLCKRQRPLPDQPGGFGFRWFLPEIARHAGLLRGVATAALLSSLATFAVPLLFQVLIDKVIAHKAEHTLLAVVLAFMLIIAFDAVFGFVRQRLMQIACNKIDARLASRTFRHLLGLPLTFFEQHPAGVLARHLQQTEKLRHFLTGRLFQTLLDTVFLPLLLVLLAYYSLMLTLVVAGFSVAIALVIAAMVPAYRHRLNGLYEAEGARQAHLVETLHNIRAIKSLVLEPMRQRDWDDRLAQSLRQHDAVGRIGAAGSVLTAALEKLMQVSVMGLGALLVFEGRLSIGALVAFTMLSNRVTGPLVQIVALISEYQEAALSLRMLGTVMNATPERAGGARPARPAVSGALEFDDVRFSYPGAAMPALDGVSFRVEPGQVIGIVGRSGSGKTTITRLIQSIHLPQAGLVRLDGVDIRHIDLDHLRRHVGVVLQDNLLLRGTIRENIAAARPDAPIEEVIDAARMAGAEEFIDRLPLSYDTPVEEGASNFSGGQRQRLAIARALLMRPPLLILDEATSALDPDSEAIIQGNLAKIARGRTLLVVSHRLSSLVQADGIIVLERGRLVDFAPHAALLDRCDIYRHLWQQQTQHVR